MWNGRAEGHYSGHLTEAAAIARPVRRIGSVRGERAISGTAKEGRGRTAAAVLLQRIGDEAVSRPRAAFPARSGAVETGGVRRAARAPAALSAHSDTVATGIRRGRYAEQSLLRASIALAETMRTGWTCAWPTGVASPQRSCRNPEEYRARRSRTRSCAPPSRLRTRQARTCVTAQATSSRAATSRCGRAPAGAPSIDRAAAAHRARCTQTAPGAPRLDSPAGPAWLTRWPKRVLPRRTRPVVRPCFLPPRARSGGVRLVLADCAGPFRPCWKGAPMIWYTLAVSLTLEHCWCS
jgi:hypothetical protein